MIEHNKRGVEWHTFITFTFFVAFIQRLFSDNRPQLCQHNTH
ncbi:hypothetical protein yaldo0001_15230 [Yersinia aldovae ATCC 35236]|nr:hypothetical protein yaldo0001_15230 [Yersinia aldovae ATCC 35236]